MKRKPKSRREALQATAFGLLGMQVAQGGSEWTPKKKLVEGPIRSGHLLFLGGIGGWYPERRPDGPGDIRQQTSDALEMMKASLQKAGSSMANVIMVQVSLVVPERNWEPRRPKKLIACVGSQTLSQLHDGLITSEDQVQAVCGSHESQCP